jgi:hypothetical protein
VVPLADFDPAQPRLALDPDLVSPAAREDIEAVFEFVADVARADDRRIG